MTQNTFPCSKCGQQNYIGDPSCRHCAENFQYYCPQCQAKVTGSDSACPNCGGLLNWPAKKDQPARGAGEDEVKDRPKSGGNWAAPLVGLVIIIIIAAAGIYALMKLSEKPNPPIMVDNTTTAKPKDVFIPDTKPPVISNIVVENLTYNSVEIRWTTDEPSTSQVLWGLKDEYPQPTAQKEALVTQHSVELANLKTKATYFFKVRSVDQVNNESTSEEKSFDIGKQPGIAKVEVYSHSLQSREEPSGTRTYIIGEIRNIGDLTLRLRDIEVIIKFEVAGRPGSSEVYASLNPSPEEVSKDYVHKFTAMVPNGTKPNYTITARVVNQ